MLNPVLSPATEPSRGGAVSVVARLIRAAFPGRLRKWGMVEVHLPLASRPVRYGLVAAVAAVVLVSSVVETGATPTSPGPFGLVGMDKWSHALAYAGLAATLAYASVESQGRGRLVPVVSLTIAFGIGVELLQWPIPYRTASAADALADAVGACLLALGWWWLGRFARFVPTADRREPV